ncbi:MAG: magnesium transporter [Acidiferrobacterales bacterium]
MSKRRKSDIPKRIRSALHDGRPETVRAVLEKIHPADIANFLESVPAGRRPEVLALADSSITGKVLMELGHDARADLISRMDSASLVAAARGLDIDDVADLIPDLSNEAVSEILFVMDKQNRQRLDTVLSYPRNSAGGLMNIDMITVRENLTLEVVLRYVRKRGNLPENTDKLFVVNRAGRLSGTLPLSRLLSGGLARLVSQAMDCDVVKFRALTPGREVAEAFRRYNLVTAPVVDDDNRLIGRITVDDVVEAIREEVDRSAMAFVGLKPVRDAFSPVARNVRSRFVSLAGKLLIALAACGVVYLFKHAIVRVVALAVLLPVVASMGRNAGMQTLTLVIYGMKTGKIRGARVLRALLKELVVGAVNGCLLAAIVAAVTYFVFGNVMLGVIAGAAMMVNLVIASVSGVILPFLMRRARIDPVLAAPVVLAAVTDIVGLVVFFGFATVFMR